MAKSEIRTGKGSSSPFSAALRPDRAVLGLGIIASFLIAVLFKVDLFAVGPTGMPASGEYASRSFKAPFDITFVDQEATDTHRAAAGEQAKAVYDYDERAGADLRERIHQAFGAARAVLESEATEGAIAADPALKFLEVLTETFRNMFIAERSFPAGEGARKHQFVLDSVKPMLDVPNSPALSDIGSITELLETIGQIVSLIVKLMNMLGVFKRRPKPGEDSSATTG